MKGMNSRMTGKSHKAIGTAVGLAFTVYGVLQSRPEFALALVTAPISAMIPDIDHNNSRMGKTRKKVVDFLVIFITVVLVGTVIYWYMTSDTSFLSVALGVAAPILALYLLSQIPAVKKTWGFARKHRGIMHTLLVPICMIFAVRAITDPYVLIMVYGAIAGYASHILADTFTKKGCPIFFPITQKHISISNITTGTDAEKKCAWAIMAAIVFVPVLLFFI